MLRPAEAWTSTGCAPRWACNERHFIPSGLRVTPVSIVTPRSHYAICPPLRDNPLCALSCRCEAGRPCIGRPGDSWGRSDYDDALRRPRQRPEPHPNRATARGLGESPFEECPCCCEHRLLGFVDGLGGQDDQWRFVVELRIG